MAKYPNLAGRETELLDGNLQDNTLTEIVSTVIIGTADKGPSNFLWPARDRTAAKNAFGTGGTLLQGMYEAYAAGAPLVLLWRIGGIVAKVEGIGSAITLQTVESKTDIGDEYYVEWKDSVLKVWRDDGTLVYESSFVDGVQLITTDLGEVVASANGDVSTDNALEFEGDSEQNGVQMSLLDTGYAVSGLTYTEADPETTPTKKRLYELLDKAYSLLEDEAIHFVVPMDALLDELNVADVPNGSGPPTTYFNTTDYLGYLYKSEDGDGNPVYTWADTKVTDDYHEVNFAHQLATFCHDMTVNELSVHGVVGVRPPADNSGEAIHVWVGKLPTYSPTTGLISTNGRGLLGNKFMSGTTAVDPGFWATQTGYLDDPDILQDTNERDIDIGKYISVSADWLRLRNSYAIEIGSGSGYVASSAATYGGFIASLNPDVAPSYKNIPASFSINYKIGKSKVNDLAGQHYIVNRWVRGAYLIADGPTAARETSDYRRFTTFNIVKFCEREIRKIADRYIGGGMNPAKRAALKTELESRFKDILREGFIQRFNFTLTQTPIMAVNGQLNIFVDLVPAFELRKITTFIAVRMQ